MSDRVRRYPSTRLLDLKDVGAQTPTLLPGCSGAHPVAGMHQGSVGEDGTDRQGTESSPGMAQRLVDSFRRLSSTDDKEKSKQRVEVDKSQWPEEEWRRGNKGCAPTCSVQ
jgi:hypothetical protein